MAVQPFQRFEAERRSRCEPVDRTHEDLHATDVQILIRDADREIGEPSLLTSRDANALPKWSSLSAVSGTPVES